MSLVNFYRYFGRIASAKSTFRLQYSIFAVIVCSTILARRHVRSCDQPSLETFRAYRSNGQW